MRELMAGFQATLVWLCVVGLFSLAAVAAFPVASDMLSRLRRLFGRSKVQGVVAVAAVCLAVLYGGSKNGTVTYPRTDPEVYYLLDIGSYVTNDAVHVAFAKNLIVPDSAWFWLYALERSYTNNSDWAEHSIPVYSNQFENMTIPLDVPFQAATNFNFMGFTDWTPSPTTHTNGVAYVVWQVGVNKPTNNIAMIRTGVYTNAVRLAPNHAITNGPALSLQLQLVSPTQTPSEETP